MTSTRILLFDIPHLVRDMLVREVLEAPDMDLVGELCDGDGLVALARSSQPDFIVVSVDDGEVPEACQQVFREQPLIRVLGLIADAGRLYLHELRPGRQDIGYVRPAEIVYTIRGAASRPSLT